MEVKYLKVSPFSVKGMIINRRFLLFWRANFGEGEGGANDLPAAFIINRGH